MDISKINIGQIGVGYWGPNLLRNLIKNKKCKVLSVADPSKERRQYVNSLYPAVKTYSETNEIIKDPNIDAVVIATPVKTHYDITINSLKNGKSVLVEKPMATSVEDVENIEKLSNEKNLTAMVGHTFLFNPAVNFIKKKINEGLLGEIRYIYSQRLNLGRIRSDVDALWNLAPHDISIIQYWLGDPDPIKINKNGIDFIQKGIDDVSFLNIKYPDNIMANIHVSWLDPQKIRKMTIVGSKKMILYDDISDNKVLIYDKGIDKKAELKKDMYYDKEKIIDLDLRSGDVLIPKINWQEPLAIEIDHFLDCIRGEKCISGANHAKKVVKILNGV